MVTKDIKPILNKKNLIRFAENLYKDTGKNIEYMPLCSGTLAEANGEILHCALGELHEEFIGKIARRATKEEISLCHGSDKNKAVVIFKEDSMILADLLKIAITKYNNKFRIGMNAIPEINDDPVEENLKQPMKQNIYIERAKRIQKHLFEIANYLE